MNTRIRFTIIAIVLLAQCSLFAQNDDSVNPCFSRDDLVKMVHLPVEGDYDTALMVLLIEKGYTTSNIVFSRLDTVNSIVLEYECHVYYDRVEEDQKYQKIPTVYVCVSKNGLNNMIIINLTRHKDCIPALEKDFATFTISEINNLTTTSEGISGIGNQNAKYSIAYKHEGDELLLIFKKQEEIDTYVNQEIAKRTSEVQNIKNQANYMAKNMQFDTAYKLLNTALGIYPPLDESILDLQKNILNTHKELIFKQIKECANQGVNNATCISLCDSLLSLITDDGKDSIRHIRQTLMDQSEGRINLYSTLHPESYRQTLNTLDSIINREIRQYCLDKTQTLTLNFKFNTSTTNNSSGTINLNTHLNWLQSSSSERSRNQQLQEAISDLASSNIIQPVYEYGVATNTYEEINAKIEWWNDDLDIDEDSKLNDTEKKYVDIIEEQYFKIPDPRRPGQKITRMPYHREYHFSVTTKVYDDSTYTDVLLTDFSTSNVFSWMPSLIIPGLSTTKHGKLSNVTSRAIPFFLFGGLAVTGYLLENNGNEKTEWSDSGPFWEHKNFGNILLFGGGIIAASIYITDIVESIKAVVTNRSRSKAIREKMKADGNFKVHMEDIHIH